MEYDSDGESVFSGEYSGGDYKFDEKKINAIKYC